MRGLLYKALRQFGVQHETCTAKQLSITGTGLQCALPQQNKLLFLMQASERDLCVLLNTLAALLLGQAPTAEPPTPSSAKGKGKAKAKAKHKPAAADGMFTCCGTAS